METPPKGDVALATPNETGARLESSVRTKKFSRAMGVA